MFDELTLHGPRGTLLWGYREVAGLRWWRINKSRPWTLTATVDRADGWQCRQASTCRELLFTAPRAGPFVLDGPGCESQHDRAPGDLGPTAAVGETHG